MFKITKENIQVSCDVTVTPRVDLLQATFVLLDLGLAAGAAFGDEFGKMFALSLHTHPFIVTSIIHPLRHVAAARRIMGLQGAESKRLGYRATLSGNNVCVCETSGKLQLKQEDQPHLEQVPMLPMVSWHRIWSQP